MLGKDVLPISPGHLNLDLIFDFQLSFLGVSVFIWKKQFFFHILFFKTFLFCIGV